MKKKYFLFSLFFLSQYASYAQSVKVSDAIATYMSSLNTTNIDKTVVDKIATLLQQKEQELAEAKKIESTEAQNPMPFLYYDEIKPETINRKFMRALMDVVTMDQYKQMFLPQLEGRIQRAMKDRYDFVNTTYQFNPEQSSKYKSLLYDNTVNEIVMRNYYSYDNDWSYNLWTQEKLKSAEKELNLMETFKMIYVNDYPMHQLMRKMEAQKIDNGHISEIMKLLVNEKIKQQNSNITWRDGKQRNAIEFYDAGGAAYAIQMQLRLELRRHLTYEQFKAVFQSQMQTRIDREAEEAFVSLKEAYKDFTPKQYKEIHELVVQKYIDHVVTEEFYKHSTELYQQKVRTSDYKHDTLIREKMDGFAEKYK